MRGTDLIDFRKSYLASILFIYRRKSKGMRSLRGGIGESVGRDSSTAVVIWQQMFL